MPSLTTNFSLNKPLVNSATDQDLWGGYLNDNEDTVDAALKTARDFVTRSISGADTATSADRNKLILCNASGAALTPVLPSAATVAAGFEIAYKKTDSSGNSVTVTRAAAETIDGATTYVLSGQYDSVCLVSDGSNWHVKAYKTTPTSVASASTSVQGIVQLATTADVQGGSSSSLGITPSGLLAALGFSEYYESAETAITLGTQVAFTHALGAIPRLVIGELVCKTTDDGYAVDDRIPFLSNLNSGGNQGIMFSYNATQIMFTPGSSNISVLNQDTGVISTITTASWRVVLRAWR